jgi:hypothetical protein
MRESAKQGFWNGTTPPLGYRIVEAERRGSKIKKRLEVDPVEAELVCLIFRLYVEGDGTVRSASRKPPNGSMSTAIARAVAQPSASVLSTTSSEVATTRLANGRTAAEILEPVACTIRPPSSRSTFHPSFLWT